MKLYHIGRPDRCGWDEYSGAVVAARCEEDARLIHPDGYTTDERRFTATWVAPERVIVTLIGTSIRGTKAGVIEASFNAG